MGASGRNIFKLASLSALAVAGGAAGVTAGHPSFDDRRANRSLVAAITVR